MTFNFRSMVPAMAAVFVSCWAGLAAGEIDKTATLKDRFEVTSPLGINVNDIAALNAMPEQKLLETGFLDVTRQPFNADPTGKMDSTKAIADAVCFGRFHKLAVYFPTGEYLVSDTIPCNGGVSDERTSNHKFLPFVEMWPCVLIGEQRGKERPVIVLAPRSVGFNDPKKPKVVLDFVARSYQRGTKGGQLKGNNGATGFNQLFYGIDIRIGHDNPGAAAVSFDAAEGSTLQDATFDVGNGLTGILGGPGSGGAVFNVTIRGGAVGALLNSHRPSCTLVACRFSGQRDAAVEHSQRGPLCLVGCEFEMRGSAVVLRSLNYSGRQGLRIRGSRNSSSALIDCRIDYSDSDPSAHVIDARTALYMRNTWVRNVKSLLVSDQAGEIALDSSGGWTCVGELAAPYSYEGGPLSSVFVNGVKSEGIFKDIRTVVSPPSDLRTRHIWDAGAFPAWNSPGVVNVREAPYFAKGDGKTDDHAILQRAINENETLFLPKGAYRISKTLQLKPRTKIIGISPSYSMIVPVTVAGGDFCDRKHPQPALRTVDKADAETILAFFSVFMPREDVQAAFMLHWACGGKSILRCVSPITGHTNIDFVPLKAGIRPWHNWNWTQMDGFSDDLYRIGAIVAIQSRNRSRPGTPDWPMALVNGHGAGGWYPFYALDGRFHGPNQRRILVENTAGPFAIYQAHLQYNTGQYEMEIKNAGNVALYGIKSEGSGVILNVLDSKNILASGYAGPCHTPKDGKYIVRNSRDVTFFAMPNDYMDPPDNKLLPVIHAVLTDGRTVNSGSEERPVLFKITDDQIPGTGSRKE